MPFIDHVLDMHRKQYDTCLGDGGHCKAFLERTVWQYPDRAYGVQYSAKKGDVVMPWAESLSFMLYVFHIVMGERSIQGPDGRVMIEKMDDLRHLQVNQAALHDSLFLTYANRTIDLRHRYPVTPVHTPRDAVVEVLQDALVQERFPGATYDLHVFRRRGRKNRDAHSSGHSALARPVSHIIARRIPGRLSDP
ncbi:MAG: hypothetical protein V1735_01250 [Nanoarchaeota archaeon]